jgi:hypothetical protein
LKALLLIALILIVVLAGCMSTPNPTEAPIVLISPTPTIEMSSTPIITEIMIDAIPASFPLGDSKEAFEKGEYADGMGTIKGWVKVWDGQKIFDDSEVRASGLTPVVIDGKARVVCVASKKEKRITTLFCPPIDTINGGLKSIPDVGEPEENDKPLIVKFEGTEGLTTRSTGTNLVYQFIDKYTKSSIKYIDAKTGNIVEGSCRVPLEVEENELVEKSTICVADEFCMGGQMEIDPESAKILYKGFLTALVQSKENEEYFESILGGDLSYEALTEYIDKNDGKIPAGLKIIRDQGKSYFSMNLAVDKPVNLSTLKVITFGPKEWKNNEGNIQEYINNFENKGLASIILSDGVSLFTYGWLVDDDGFLVLVSGSKNYEKKVSTLSPISIMGEKDGAYLPSRDNLIATSTFISWIKFMERSDRYIGNRFFVEPLSVVVDAITASEEDVNNFYGNKTLFLD